MGMRLEERSQDVRRDRLYRPLVKRTQLSEISCVGTACVWRMIGVGQVRKKYDNQRFQ